MTIKFSLFVGDISKKFVEILEFLQILYNIVRILLTHIAVHYACAMRSVITRVVGCRSFSSTKYAAIGKPAIYEYITSTYYLLDVIVRYLLLHEEGEARDVTRKCEIRQLSYLYGG